MKNLFLLLACMVLCAAFAPAQTGRLVEQDDAQSWNDIQLTVPMSKRFDFFTQATFRFGKDISRLNDRRIAVGLVWKPTKYLIIT